MQKTRMAKKSARTDKIGIGGAVSTIASGAKSKTKQPMMARRVDRVAPVKISRKTISRYIGK